MKHLSLRDHSRFFPLDYLSIMFSKCHNTKLFPMTNYLLIINNNVLNGIAEVLETQIKGD